MENQDGAPIPADIDDSAMRAEYDMRGGVRGKFASRFKGDVVKVTLVPDVAAAFPDADAVNEALRVLIKTARNVVPAA